MPCFADSTRVWSLPADGTTTNFCLTCGAAKFQTFTQLRSICEYAKTMSHSPIRNDLRPYDDAATTAIVHDFQRDGYRVIPGVLDADEVRALRTAVDRVFAEPRWADNHNLYGPYVATRLFEVDPVFEDMLTREPIISLAESILGPDCHLVAQNVVRNAPGQAIDFWHVDDVLIFPTAPDMARHDARLTMPVHILTVQILLTDVDGPEHGPTQFVPGSHYSGKQPNDRHTPSFEGVGPVSLFGKAGDIYLHNGQAWHRGAPNTSDRTRYLLQLAYSRRWVSQRLYPFVNYQLPNDVVERADERRRRVLGLHAKGAYG
jgi:hypothetical protein